MDLVTLENKNNKSIISLNNVRKLNVLNEEMVDLMSAFLSDEQLKKSNTVIIKGNGDKGFCAGGDVVSVIKGYEEGREADFFFKKEYELDQQIYNLPMKSIALLHGVTMGGGVGLTHGCDLKVADPELLFAMPEVTIGFFPDVGASYFLNKIPKRWAIIIGLFGARLNAFELKELGLVDFVISRESWDSFIEGHLSESEFLSGDIPISSQAKDDFLAKDLDLLVFDSLETFSEIEEFVKNYSGHSWIEKSIQTGLDGSLLSRWLFWELLSFGHGKDFKECFEKEHQLSCLMDEDSDFKEGVRALLIDKDKNPSWRVDSIEQLESSSYSKFRHLFK